MKRKHDIAYQILRRISGAVVVLFFINQAGASIIVDNTSEQTETVSTSSGASLSESEWVGLTFSIQDGMNLSLSSLVIPMRLVIGTSQDVNVTVSVYNSSSSEMSPFPSSEISSAGTLVTVTDSIDWFEVDLSGMDTLSGGSSYSIVFSTDDDPATYPRVFWCSMIDRNGTSDITADSSLDSLYSIYSGDAGNSWSRIGNAFGMELTGSVEAVPEPASALMLLFGGSIGFGVHRLRRRAGCR